MRDKVTLRLDGILYVMVIGKQTDEEVKGSSEISDRLIREHNLKKIKYLVDFSEAGSSFCPAGLALMICKTYI